MTIRKITLVPYAGLCNRLNAIASALAYKEKYPDIELTILWQKRRHCNCRFRDLFKQLPSPYTQVKELILQIKAIPGTRYNLHIPEALRHIFGYDYSFLPGDSADKFDELTKNKKNVYVYKDNRFCKEILTQSLATVFIPKDDIQCRIDSITRDWNGKVIGLHIRRTDNIVSIKESPLAHFLEVINKETAQDAETRFYLATDDEEVKDKICSLYGDRIITTPLCLERNSLQGMKDAVVDLYCLGYASKIYGSAHSTYSTFAAKLFDREIIV